MMSEKEICWSKFPQETYAVPMSGGLMGVGTNPIFAAVPGAWNILTLMWADVLDSLLTWSGTPDEYPYDCGLIPYAVGTALQRYMPSVTLGELALHCTPAEFLARLKNFDHKEKVIMIGAFQEEFWTRAEAFAAAWAPPVSGNIIRGCFGQKAILQ